MKKEKKTFFKKNYTILLNSLLLATLIAPTPTVFALQSATIKTNTDHQTNQATHLLPFLKTSTKKNKKAENLIFTDQKAQEKKRFWMKVCAAILAGSCFYWLFNENIYNFFTIKSEPGSKPFAPTGDNRDTGSDDSSGDADYTETADNSNRWFRSYTNRSNTVTIPSQLENQYDAFQLTHLRSTEQKGFTCGFWATANTYAIRDQFNRNLPITYMETLRLAQYYFQNILESHNIFAQCLENGSIRFQSDEEIHHLAQSVFVTENHSHSIPGLYIISPDSASRIFNPTHADAFGFSEGGDGAVESLMSRTSMIDRLRNGESLQYIINPGAHWTSLSVLPTNQNGNRTYQVIYLDSQNSQISTNGLVHDLLGQINGLIQEII